ncbi:DMT family transporter [Alicyclobacillus sp. SO9]|uniref:DMT family transporter n=1 Tax=Alicyclobacillus sp. SO9 TaxID=2665646 RepID=UPI0018E8B66B|nr:DMT family transporter [Alicyclobacillus sp. SO9]QQE79973.1 DMT family transporter [Alicyclobacillus sp. SO9]
MPFVALLLVSALWGIHPVVGKVAEQELNPTALTVWRFTLGALCYLPFYGRFRRWFQLSARMVIFLGLGTLCWAMLYPLFYYQSLHDLPPVETLLIINTAPLLAAVFGWMFLRERLTGREWSGITLSFLGILVLVAGEWTGTHHILGVVYAGLAVLAFSAYTLLSRVMFKELPLLDVLVMTSTTGAVMLWVYTLVTGQFVPTANALGALTASGWMQLLYIVLFVSTLAYALYGYGLRRAPAGIGSALTFYPQVIFTALAQWLWLGQAPTGLTLMSAAAILGGTALVSLRLRKGESEPSG